jgi:hypothetical protein
MYRNQETIPMKRVLVITVLALLLMSTLGAGAVAAKKDENPSKAGNSSVYFYDVAANETHGKGKLMVDVDKHTFVFNGQGFMPSAMIALKARAAGSDDYVIFATGKVTPSGNLHIAGTWEADAAPEEVGTYYAPLTGFKLENTGWFVAKLACYYSTDGGVTWTETDHSSGIAKGGSDRVDWLIDLGVPDGALVKIHAIVVGGKDRTGDVWEYCDHMGSSWGYHVTTELAVYEISGVTWNPKLEWVSMTG